MPPKDSATEMIYRIIDSVTGIDANYDVRTNTITYNEPETAYGKITVSDNCYANSISGVIEHKCSQCENWKRKEETKMKNTPKPAPAYGPFAIRSVLSNRKKNAFSVVWMDGTTTVVHCQDGDEWDDEKALAMCFTKKALGNKGNFNDKFNDALDNKMKVIPAEKATGGTIKMSDSAISFTRPITLNEEAVKKMNEAPEKPTNAFGVDKQTAIELGKAAAKANVALKDMINALTDEPIKIQRYDLFLMDPCGDKTEIYHQGTDEEIHKAMRAYRMKHYPTLEKSRTPYRMWMLKDNLMVDFGAGSYFMVPGMDHDTFVKGK